MGAKAVEAAVELDELRAEDWSSVAAIYEEGIRSGDATFETRVPDWAGWDAAHLPSHRLVARLGGEVVGWAACGFRVVGRRERIGKLGGEWRDVVLLERRSPVVC